MASRPASRASSRGASPGGTKPVSVVHMLEGIFSDYAHGAKGSSATGGSAPTSRTRRSSSPSRSPRHRYHDTEVTSEEEIEASRHSFRVSQVTEENIHIVTMWKEAKAELESKRRLISQLQSRVSELERAQEEKQEAIIQRSSTDRVNETLRDKLRFVELQMINMQDENANLKQQLMEERLKREEANKVIDEKRASESHLSSAVRELEARLQAIDSEKKAIMERSMHNLRAYEEDTIISGQEKTALQTRADALEENLKQVRSERISLLEQVQSLQTQNNRLQSTADQLENDLAAIRVQLKGLQGAAAVEQDLRAQTQHLRLDLARLVRLLVTTREYHQFASFAFPPDARNPHGRARSAYLAPSDTAASAGLDEYLGGPAVPATAPLGRATEEFDEEEEYDTAKWEEMAQYESQYGLDDSQPLNTSGEGDLWVPAEAVRLATSFRRKHLGHVPLAMIREFLVHLNSVWRKRFNRQTQRVKDRYLAQIKELKRMLSQRMPYREVIQGAEIKRLSHDVTTLRSTKFRGRSRSRSKKSSSSASSSRLVMTQRDGHEWCSRMKVVKSPKADISEQKLFLKSISTVDNLARRVHELTAQNKELEESVLSMSGTSVSKHAAKAQSMAAFSRGITWFGRQAVAHADVMGEQLVKLTSQMHRSCASLAGSTGNVEEVRTQIRAASAVESEVTQFRTALRRLFEKTLAAGQDPRKFDRLLENAGAAPGTGGRDSSSAVGSPLHSSRRFAGTPASRFGDVSSLTMTRTQRSVSPAGRSRGTATPLRAAGKLDDSVFDSPAPTPAAGRRGVSGGASATEAWT